MKSIYCNLDICQLFWNIIIGWSEVDQILLSLIRRMSSFYLFHNPLIRVFYTCKTEHYYFGVFVVFLWLLLLAKYNLNHAPPNYNY